MGGGQGRVPGQGTARGAGGSLVPQPPAVATPDRGGGGILSVCLLSRQLRGAAAGSGARSLAAAGAWTQPASLEGPLGTLSVSWPAPGRFSTVHRIHPGSRGCEMLSAVRSREEEAFSLSVDPASFPGLPTPSQRKPEDGVAGPRVCVRFARLAMGGILTESCDIVVCKPFGRVT